MVAEELTNNKAIGWMQGRMEFGPRALGGRSIIVDPRSQSMQKQLSKVNIAKAVPFAPSVLIEDVNEWFTYEMIVLYMLFVTDLQDNKLRIMNKQEESLFGIDKLNIPRSSIPAITHVDYSARIQTVHKDTNPLFHAVISKFKEKLAVHSL